MLPNSLFLAQAENANATDEGFMQALERFFARLDILNHPDELLDILATMPFIGAAVIFIVGLICVFNGYRWHKWVIVILAFLSGLVLGKILGMHFDKPQIVAVAIGLLCAIVATPMLRIAVAIFGGMVGAFIGANAWTAINVEQADVHWAGAVMGFIVLAMASFILFKLVVVFFTSIGGAAMTVFGGITLLMQVEGWEPAIRDSLATNQLMLPMLVAVAAVGGFVLQQHMLGKQEVQQQQKSS